MPGLTRSRTTEARCGIWLSYQPGMSQVDYHPAVTWFKVCSTMTFYDRIEHVTYLFQVLEGLIWHLEVQSPTNDEVQHAASAWKQTQGCWGWQIGIAISKVLKIWHGQLHRNCARQRCRDIGTALGTLMPSNVGTYYVRQREQENLFIKIWKCNSSFRKLLCRSGMSKSLWWFCTLRALVTGWISPQAPDELFNADNIW